jgi:hypothetical protein
MVSSSGDNSVQNSSFEISSGHATVIAFSPIMRLKLPNVRISIVLIGIFIEYPPEQVNRFYPFSMSSRSTPDIIRNML